MPIIILSATLERRFGGVEDMHLLKGYSSSDDLVNALRSFEAKLRGKPVVVNARDFFYSRINMAMGDDVLLEVLDGEGNWQYVNETCARLLEHPVEWFQGRNMFEEFPEISARLAGDSADRRDHARNLYRPDLSGTAEPTAQGRRSGFGMCSAFPMTLHNNKPGVVLTARILERKS